MVKFGIIGAGRIAVKFCEAVAMVQDAVITAVASKDVDRARLFAESNSIPLYFGSYEEMLKRADIDIVYVATTHNFHYDNIKLCFKHRKGVLCEKSMVMHCEQARELFAEAAQKGLFLAEAMWARHLPAMQKAKQWIDDGEIGELKFADCVLGFKAPDEPENRLLNPDLGGGAAYDISVYAIEMTTFLLGNDFNNVKGFTITGKTGVDVLDVILLDYGDRIASLRGSLVANPHGEDLRVSGTLGTIVVHSLAGASSCTLMKDGCEPIHFDGSFKNGFQYEIAEVVSCVKNKKITSDAVPPEVTIRCAEIFDRLLPSEK